MDTPRTSRTRLICLTLALWLCGSPAPAQQQTAPPAKPAQPPAKPAADKPAEKPALPKPSAPDKPPAAEISNWMKRTTELRASLDKVYVTLNAQKVKLSDAVRALASSQAKVNIVLDDTLPASTRDREVTLSLHNVTLRAALTALTRPDLAFEVMYEAICISTRAGIADLIASAPVIPEDLTAEGKAVVEALQRKLISFSFENARFQDAAAVISQLTGVKIIVDPGVPAEKFRSVTLSLADVHLASALFYLTGKELNCAVSFGKVLISTNEGVQKEMAQRAVIKKRMAEKTKFGELLAKPVTAQFTKTPLNDAVAELTKATKVMIVFDPVALQQVGSKATVTAKLDNVPLDTALSQILPEKLDYSVSDEGTIEIQIKGTKKPAAPPAPK